MDIHQAYEILGVSPLNSIDDVKRAYRRLCLKYHPDKCNGTSDQFIQIKTAYNTILHQKESNINFFLVFMFFVRSMNVKARDVHLKIEVSIQDIYNNCVKKIAYRRTNELMRSELSYVYLELCDFKAEYRIEGRGDYSVWSGQWSDLLISTTIDYAGFEHITRDQLLNDTDLHMSLKVNLYEYFFGIERSILFFNNTNLPIHHTPSEEGLTIVVEGKGLCDSNSRRGNLYIFFEVDATKCDKELVVGNREVLKNIFNKE